MAFFVMLTSVRYISLKLIDEAKVFNEEGESVEYRHPVLQSMAGYLGEFLIVIILYFILLRYDPS